MPFFLSSSNSVQALIAHAVLQPDQQIQRCAGQRRIRGRDFVFKRRFRQIFPLFRLWRTAFGIPDDTQRGNALGDIIRALSISGTFSALALW
jgi:hypothetical protein